MPLNRVSFYGKNYATGCPFLIKIMRQGIRIDKKIMNRVSCGRMPFRVLLKQWILAKFLCDRVYFWAIFYAIGYRVWRDLPHTPVTSLVKYPLGVVFSTNTVYTG